MTDKHNKPDNLCTSSERPQNKCPYCNAVFSDDQFWIFHKVIGSGEPLKQWIENSIKELQSNG